MPSLSKPRAPKKHFGISHLHASQQKSIHQYLKQYGEEEALHIASLQPHGTHYQRCLVIPVYNESTECVHRLLDSELAKESLLLIVIVNQPDNDNDTSKNSQFWQTCLNQFTSIRHADNAQWLNTSSQVDILLVDRFHQKLPQKQGVGLARKIGTDIALQLIVQGGLRSDWIHHTDADTHLPNQYFKGFDRSLQQQPHSSAGIYAYQHNVSTPYTPPSNEHNLDIKIATALYEKSLHHYVDGLRSAGSPYSYHTLGSCLVVNSTYYAKARGFPKRAAGEDFYLVNKLAKLAPIMTIDSVTLSIEARLSDRVPFGTGPAVSRIMTMKHPEKDFLFYHPHCFHELKIVLKQFNTLFAYKPASCNDPKNTTHYQTWLNTFSPELRSSLIAINIETLFIHISNNIRSAEQCLHHCHLWLDAFKTLKLIHALERYYPKQTGEFTFTKPRE